MIADLGLTAAAVGNGIELASLGVGAGMSVAGHVVGLRTCGAVQCRESAG